MNNITIKGISETQKGLDKVLKDITQYIPRALNDVGLDLLGKAKDLAPIESGDLKGSGFAEIENNKTAIVGFTEPYALKQHESLEFKHPLGGQAKYLEEPFKNNLSRYIQHIKDAIRKVVE